MHTKTETLLGSMSSTEYAYDGAGRLLSETKDGAVIAYTYDANGNTLSAGNKSYTYNARGQQVGYSDGTSTASYAYNPSGLRSAKTVGGATKHFVYNGMNIVYEYDAGGTEETVYYYGLNRTHNSDGEIYVYNAHGDVVQLVKDNAVTVSYTYDAFGNRIGTVGESDNAFLYCGEYYDAETETYYLRARYYNPANGRFSTEDTHWNVSNMLYGDSPVKMNEYEDALGLNKYTLLPNTEAIGQSSNLYVYCINNPMRYLDSTGNSLIAAAAVAAGTAGLGFLISAGVTWLITDVLTQLPPVTLPSIPSITTMPGIEEPVMFPKTFDKSVRVEEAEQEVTISRTQSKDYGSVYYHVTTPENAALIMASGIMKGSIMEGGYVFAWRLYPDKYAMKNAGVHHGVVIAFQTNAAFERDKNIEDQKILKYLPVRSVFQGPISVKNVSIVG